jgi:hypothetical protein
MLGFLRIARYIGLLIVVVSVPAFLIAAGTIVMFCDHGPVSTCFLLAGAIVAILLLQIIALVAAFLFVKQNRRLRLACGLLLLSVTPSAAGLIFLSH